MIQRVPGVYLDLAARLVLAEHNHNRGAGIADGRVSNRVDDPGRKACEIAGCLLFGVSVSTVTAVAAGSSLTSAQPDIPGVGEIKATRLAKGNLLIHGKATLHDGWRYILARYHDLPYVEFPGWAWGYEVREWWEDAGRLDRPGWLVPAKELRPIAPLVVRARQESLRLASLSR